MSIKAKVDQLWAELESAFTAAYGSTQLSADDKHAIRDYVPNQTWHDALAQLLEAEKANEKQHRGSRPVPAGFSSITAAKLILMGNFAEGSFKTEMPPATNFLIWRKTAAEAVLVGYLIRHFLPGEWSQRVRAFDYAKLMQERTA